MAKLGEVCDILNGYAFKSNQYTTSGVRIIRISNVQKGYIEDKSPVYYPCDDENVKKYELKQNDLLISLTGNVGRTALLEEKFLPAALNQRVSCVRLKEPDKVLKTYLFHLLNSDYFEQQCMKAAEGVAQKNLSPKWLFEYKIPIYSIERQKEISNTLDKIDLLIILRKQQLAKLDELVKARFVEMFENSSWPNTSLNDICSEIVDCPHSTPKYEGNLEHPAIRTTEIKKGYIDWDSMKYVSEEEYQKRIKSLKPVPGDIVYGREGTYGNAAIIPDGYEFCLGQRVMLFRPNKTKCISAYVLYAILSDRVKRQADEKNVGATVPHVNVADAKQFDVVLPPLELQNQFAAFVERVDKQKQTVQQSLEKLELMKKALMQEYFG